MSEENKAENKEPNRSYLQATGSSEGNEVRLTPDHFFDSLDAEFGFSLDCCALDGMTMTAEGLRPGARCKKFYTPEQDALSKTGQEWFDDSAPTRSIWMNPPYGRVIPQWLDKAKEAALAGSTVVCLIPARTSTGWFFDRVHGKREVRFVKGRLTFDGLHKDKSTGELKPITNPAPFGVMVVVISAIENSVFYAMQAEVYKEENGEKKTRWITFDPTTEDVLFDPISVLAEEQRKEKETSDQEGVDLSSVTIEEACEILEESNPGTAFSPMEDGTVMIQPSVLIIDEDDTTKNLVMVDIAEEQKDLAPWPGEAKTTSELFAEAKKRMPLKQIPVLNPEGTTVTHDFIYIDDARDRLSDLENSVLDLSDAQEKIIEEQKEIDKHFEESYKKATSGISNNETFEQTIDTLDQDCNAVLGEIEEALTDCHGEIDPNAERMIKESKLRTSGLITEAIKFYEEEAESGDVSYLGVINDLFNALEEHSEDIGFLPKRLLDGYRKASTDLISLGRGRSDVITCRSHKDVPRPAPKEDVATPTQPNKEEQLPGQENSADHASNPKILSVKIASISGGDPLTDANDPNSIF